MDALDLKKAIFIGHDWGGPVVWNMLDVTDPPSEPLMSEDEMDVFVGAFSNPKKPSLLGILKVYLLR